MTSQDLLLFSGSLEMEEDALDALESPPQMRSLPTCPKDEDAEDTLESPPHSLLRYPFRVIGRKIGIVTILLLF